MTVHSFFEKQDAEVNRMLTKAKDINNIFELDKVLNYLKQEAAPEGEVND